MTGDRCVQKNLSTDTEIWIHIIFTWAFLVGQTVKNLHAARPGFNPWGWEDHLEQEMATHSSILAWRIPWTEESEGYSCKESDMTEQLNTQFLHAIKYSSSFNVFQPFKKVKSILRRWAI